MGIFRSPSEAPGGWLQWITVAVPLLWAGAIVARVRITHAPALHLTDGAGNVLEGIGTP